MGEQSIQWSESQPLDGRAAAFHAGVLEAAVEAVAASASWHVSLAATRVSWGETRGPRSFETARDCAEVAIRAALDASD